MASVNEPVVIRRNQTKALAVHQLERPGTAVCERSLAHYNAHMSFQHPDLEHVPDFASTRWSLVLAARGEDTPGAGDALEALCQTYWYPLYAYVRRRGYAADDAQELTQGFFAQLIEKHYLDAADSERGRFRAFLLTALKRFLSKERHHALAEKRGGGRRILSLDFERGESRFLLDPVTNDTPESIYERQWALSLLARVMTQLRDEFANAGKRDDFDQLKAFLTGETAAPSYREVGAALGMSEGAVKVAVHRLRRRFRAAVLTEIAQTVAAPADVDDELRQLFAAVRSREA
jgi:RNA polymerase sigma-70 factor (ECF subfamily)